MREVKRKAKAGEKIKIVDEWASFGNYKNGDVLTVRISNDGNEYQNGHVFVGEHELAIMDTEYVVLEGEKEMRFKVGDKVRIVENTSAHRFEIGQPVRIKKVTISDYIAESLDGTEEWWVADKELEPAPFTLSDLKPCMVVKLRDGALGIVSTIAENEMCVNLENGMFMGLLTHKEDLSYKSDSDFDIMEVYGFSKYAHEANKISTEDRELLFKREEPKPKRKITEKEAIAMLQETLGEEIEIVKGE